MKGFESKNLSKFAAFCMQCNAMQRVCLDRQRRNPLIDRKIRGSILLMGKLNAYQKAANFDKFFDSNPFTYFH